jgi:hypothetical protein
MLTPNSEPTLTLMYRKLLPLISLFVILLPPLKAQDISDQSGFQCEEHNLFVDRFSALPRQRPLPDGPQTKVLASQNFSGFGKYGFDSVKLSIRFDPDRGSANVPVPAGGIRVEAAIESNGTATSEEIRDLGDWKLDPDAELATLLRARLVPANPDSPDSARPAVRFEQPEAGVPIFLVKFIGIMSVGGRGNVDSDNAVIFDLRQRKLSMPAALGCTKDDFPGQGPGGGFASCRWDHARGDYDCDSSEGRFLLISGAKFALKPRSKEFTRSAERITFHKGESSAVLTGSVSNGEVKQYAFSVARAGQHLQLLVNSEDKAVIFTLWERRAYPSNDVNLAGGPACDAVGHCTRWEGDLPDRAEYIVRLSGGSEPAKYTLKVSIQ